MTDYIAVHTTTRDEIQAETIARALLDAQLASCVQIHAIKSLYRWKGAVCHDPEYLLMIKSRSDLYVDIENKIKSLHTYETPQIIAMPITHGSGGYLNWIRTETTKE